MQRAVVISDEASLVSLNETLEAGEFYVEHVSANPSGTWLVILEEAEDMFDFLEEEEEAVN